MLINDEGPLGQKGNSSYARYSNCLTGSGGKGFGAGGGAGSRCHWHYPHDHYYEGGRGADGLVYIEW